MLRGATIVESDQMANGECFATRFEQQVWSGQIEDLASCPIEFDTLHVSRQDFDAVIVCARMFPEKWGKVAIIDGEVFSLGVDKGGPEVSSLPRSRSRGELGIPAVLLVKIVLAAHRNWLLLLLFLVMLLCVGVVAFDE